MNPKIKSYAFVGILIIVGLVGGFFIGLEYQKKISPIPEPSVEDADFSIVWEVWNLLKEKYIGEMNSKKMVYGAAKGMVEALGDPYTMFLEPEQAKNLEEDISGQFEGVGMYLDYKDSNVVVVAPIKGSPADQAGLKPLDKILKVNGTSTDGMSLDDTVKAIRGKSGTKIKLTILRGSFDPKNIFEVELTRQRINVPSVELEMKKSPNGTQIAVIKILQFSSNTVSEFEKKLQEAVMKDARHFIVDLRNNPGGLLDQAQAVAQYFLKKGDPIVFEGKSKIAAEVPYTAYADGPLKGYPLIVLINKGSASGAEILAAAWKDNGAAQLVGEKSFGKGSVQLPQRIRDNAMLKVTIAQWMTPLKKVIDKEGIAPDFEIKITEDDVKNEKDPQMDKAIEIIQKMP